MSDEPIKDYHTSHKLLCPFQRLLVGLFKSLNTIQREEKLLKLPTPVSSQSYAIKHNIRHFKVQKRKVLELCPRVMKLHEGLPATSDVKMAEDIVDYV